MHNRIRRIISRGHKLWQVDAETHPAKYVRYLLTRQYAPDDAERIMRNRLPLTVENPQLPLVALVHRGAIVGYRVPTWTGPRYGSAAEVRQFLQREGYTAHELASLFALAPRERLQRIKPLRPQLARGIRV